MRRDFTLASLSKGRPVLRIYHDEDATVFLNGAKVADVASYVTDYSIVDLNSPAAPTLRIGRNVIAVHFRQTQGGQFIDVGLWEKMPWQQPSECELLGYSP